MNTNGLSPILEWCRFTNKKQRQRNTPAPAFILYNHGVLLRLITIMKIRFYSSMLKLTVLVISLLTVSNVQSSNGYPRTEFPFCPGGGPLGWMNYFDYQRDKNRSRRYQRQQSPYLNPYYSRATPNAPVYYVRMPYYLSPRNSTTE